MRPKPLRTDVFRRSAPDAVAPEFALKPGRGLSEVLCSELLAYVRRRLDAVASRAIEFRPGLRPLKAQEPGAA